MAGIFKKFLTLILVFSVCIGLNACKKCISCSYKSSNATYNSGEVCDKDNGVLEAIKNDCEAKAKLSGVKCTCR